MDQYQSSFMQKDLWIEAAKLPARRNTVFNASDVVLPWQWEKSEIYNELIRPHGDDTFHCIGGAFVTDWGMGLLGINRGKNASPFGDEAVAALKENATALRRMLMVRGEIAAHRRQAEIAKSMLDIVGVPAITVRSDHQILHANEAGEAVLRQGLGFYAKNRRLGVRGEGDSKRLAAAIRDATAHLQPKTVVLTVHRVPQEGGEPLTPYQATVTPLPNVAGSSRALIMFRDPDAKDPSLHDRVKFLYRLTDAEAELAVALAEGLSLAEIASIRSVRDNTIRSQTKALAAKMQCSRQAEIAILVARIPPIQEKPLRL